MSVKWPRNVIRTNIFLRTLWILKIHIIKVIFLSYPKKSFGPAGIMWQFFMPFINRNNLTSNTFFKILFLKGKKYSYVMI